MKVLFNEQIIDRDKLSIDLEDRGFQFGDGIYEVIRIYKGKLFTLTEHFNRLERSAHELGINLPLSRDLFTHKAEELILLEHIEEGILYIQITRGTAKRVHHFPEQTKANLYAYATSYPRPIDSIKNGATAILVEDIRWLRCDIKSINLLGNVLAKQAAKEANSLEAIQFRGDYITEGSSTNVLMAKDGKLYTHPVNNFILNGITRQLILHLANQLNIPVIEERFTIEELLSADEIMITSTTAEVTPIIKINDQQIGLGIPGPIALKLQTAFEALL